MTIEALPKYMDEHLKSQDMPPGHRFSLYFKVWQNDWKRDQDKKGALKEEVTTLSGHSIKMTEALRQRQKNLALQNNASVYFPAVSTAPFMTGMGNEHPLENGFAFLNPYGLPYLPGSSVKGVLRTAAEELALGLYGETQGWDMLSVWWLFGFDRGSTLLSTKVYDKDVLVEEAKRRRDAYQNWVNNGQYDQDSLERFITTTVAKKELEKHLSNPQQFLLTIGQKDLSNRAALCFWDVYPQSKNLAKGILTPHHSGYFQGDNSPHDSEQPNPVVFLTVPPKSDFDFYCTGSPEILPTALQENWQSLLQAAFGYAFDWLGFGAKTAVGYGQMKFDNDKQQSFAKDKIDRQLKAIKDAEKLETDKKLAEMPAIERDIKLLLEENKDPGKKDYLHLLEAVKAGRWQDDDKRTVLERIQKLMENHKDWRPISNKKDPAKDKEHTRTVEVMKLMEQ